LVLADPRHLQRRATASARQHSRVSCVSSLANCLLPARHPERGCCHNRPNRAQSCASPAREDVRHAIITGPPLVPLNHRTAVIVAAARLRHLSPPVFDQARSAK
jgi:hypothetical protein